MAIQTAHQDNSRDRIVFARALWYADVQWQCVPLVFCCAGRVRNFDILDRDIKQRCGFHVRLLLRRVHISFQIAVDIWESCNPVHGTGPQVDSNSFIFRSRFELLVCDLHQCFGGRYEFSSVVIGIAVVYGLVHQRLKDGREVFVFAVVERV